MSQSVSITHQSISQTIVAGVSLETIQALYDAGMYLDAYHASVALGPLQTWSSPEGRVLAGRLANNLGAPRLGAALHWLGARAYPDNWECLYFSAYNYFRRFGAINAWRKYQYINLPDSVAESKRAEWLSLKAVMLSSLRDFARADAFIGEAIALDRENPWVLVEKASVLDAQDQREAALELLQQAMVIKPNYRPAVGFKAHCLTELGRDDEAIELLKNCAINLQSGDVWCQLATLQRELNQLDDAWESLIQTEKYWVLAESDSQHKMWLANCRSEVAYARGDLAEALRLVRITKGPHVDAYADRLQSAIDASLDRSYRIQLKVPFIRQKHRTCAPASLASIAQYWKCDIKHEEIADEICYQGTEATVERLWAESNQFYSREFRATEESVRALIRAGVPLALCTVEASSAHMQVIVGIDDIRKTFLIQDPSERYLKEMYIEHTLKYYAAHGPRISLMIPSDQQYLVEGIDLPDAEYYDELYRIKQALRNHNRAEADAIAVEMQSRDAGHRLTLEARLALTQYDANFPQALAVCEMMLQLYPENGSYRLYQLSLLDDLGRREQRLNILRAARQEKYAPIALSTRLASELIQDARDYEEAQQCLRRPLRFGQTDGRALWLQGSLLWNQGKRHDALEFYRLAACVDETDEWHARSYFSASRHLHQTHTALAWLENRNRQFARLNAAPGQTLAWALMNIDQIERAFDVLDQTVALHPEDGVLRCNVALQQGSYNHHDRATEQLEAAKGHVKQAIYERTAARLARMKGDAVQAREHYNTVMSLEPFDTTTLESLLVLDEELEGCDVAEARLREVVAKYPYCYSIRGVLIQWLRVNRFDAVHQELESFIADHPNDAWAMREKATIALMGYDFNAAKLAADQAIELDPTSDLAHQLRGQALYSLRQIDEARRAFREAIHQNIDNQNAISMLMGTCERPSDRLEQLEFIHDQLKNQTTFGECITAFRNVATGTLAPDDLLAKMKEALQHRPDLWQCYSELAEQYKSMKLEDQAVEIATAATERFPSLARTWLDLALAHRARNDQASEIAALERARDINPSWSEVAIELSETFLRTDKTADAESVLRQALRFNPQEPVLQGSLADCQYRQGDKAGAVAMIAKCCSQYVGYNWAWNALSYWSNEVDQGRTAKETANYVVNRYPHSAQAYLKLSSVLETQDDFEGALAAANRALELNPSLVIAHIQRSNCLGRMHRWDEAIAACKPSNLGGDPPFALQMQCVNLQLQKGQPLEAMKTLERALAVDSDNYDGWTKLADLASDLAQNDTYRKAAENLVRIAPYQPIPRGYLADAIMRQKGDRQQVISHLETALRWSPEYAYATNQLVDLYLEDKQAAEATRVLDFAGVHLGEHYLRAQRLRIMSQQVQAGSLPKSIAIKFLVEWCQEVAESVPDAILFGVDSFGQELADAARTPLVDEIKKLPACTAMGTALGRLLSWSANDRDTIKTLKALPVDAAWYECVRIYLLSIPVKQLSIEKATMIAAKFRKRIRANTTTWAAMASVLSQYGQNSQSIDWASNWRKHPNATARNLLPISVAYWECFRLNEANRINQHALTLPHEPASGGHRLLAGLHAAIGGDFALATQHAMEINQAELADWYRQGFRILVTACQLRPSGTDTRKLKEIWDEFLVGCFGAKPLSTQDRFTRWLAYRIRASLAASRGYRFSALVERFRAFLTTSF